MKEPIVYLRGSFLPLSEARVSPRDEGFLYGYGLFETMRGYDGKVFAVNHHMERLKKGCEGLEIPLPEELEGIDAILDTLLKRNHLHQGDSYIRITVTKGEGGQPTTFIHCKPLPGSVEEKKKRGLKGITIKVDRERKLSPYKTTNYLLMRILRTEAERRGVDEAILLNPQGQVLEGSHTNIFISRGGEVLTPPLSLPILPGVTRGIVIDLLRESGIPCHEKVFYREDLFTADEAFLTNSLIEVAPLLEVDGRKIGKGIKGKITSIAERAYRDLVGESTSDKRTLYSPPQILEPPP